MISYLEGKIIEKTTTFVVVLQSGIGYKVFVTPQLLESPVGSDIKLYTYLRIADDSHTLYGLPDFRTLEFFELLITVSGVGPKIALAMLANSSVSSLKSAIARQNLESFTSISGVGKKTAERLILELKNKVDSVVEVSFANSNNGVYEALVSLGFKQNEISQALQSVDQSLPEQEQIKQALKFLGKSK
jgi:holliday junction DNA helicase RuvA